MAKGYLCLMLHAHLPFIRHPEYESFMEEDWLFEAIIETYIPLLRSYEELKNENINFRVTMSITPTLCEMLADNLLQDRFVRKLNMLIDLSEKEIIRTAGSDFHNVAQMYHNNLKYCYDFFVNRFGKNILRAFKYFQDEGFLEIVACSATHGFMPLLNLNENAINAQIEVAVKNYYKHFGCYPKGIWNAECAYYPGLEKYLKKWGIKYFFVDTHGIIFAEKRPKYGVFAPLYCKNGVAAFARDAESSKQVWSSKEGYPGDFDYREFYRDIGYDLPIEYIRPYLHVEDIRHMTGFKYYRITATGNDKAPYNPEWAYNKVKMHASNFKFNREKQAEYLCSIIDREPIIIAPYDAELFGHWWYEGPLFIKELCREFHNSGIVSMITPSEYLKKYPVNQVSTPSMSSWGNKGYMDVWLNGANDWIYRHLHESADKMVEMANGFPDESDQLKRRVLNQMARELLISQTSCWAFIMSTGTTVSFAVKEVKDHLGRFIDLYNMLKLNNINTSALEDYEWRDTIFQEIDYMAFSDSHRISEGRVFS
jgi:1,4-alpha-glucan branching enzyme